MSCIWEAISEGLRGSVWDTLGHSIVGGGGLIRGHGTGGGDGRREGDDRHPNWRSGRRLGVRGYHLDDLYRPQHSERHKERCHTHYYWSSHSLCTTSSGLNQLQSLFNNVSFFEECQQLITQRTDVSPAYMVYQLQYHSLVALGEGIEQLLGLSLTLQGLGVGQVTLTSERTCPDVAVAQEMTVEELSAVERENAGSAPQHTFR